MANVLAFIFNFILVKHLTVVDYGVYMSLVSLLTLASIPSQSMSTVIIQFATNYFSKEEFGKAAQLYFSSSKWFFIIGMLFFFVFVASSGVIANFLHVTNPWMVILIGGMVLLTYVSIVNMSFIQGLVKFGFYAVLQMVSAGTKLMVGVVLLLLGYHVFGALWTLLIAFAIVFLVSFYPLRFIFREKTERIRISLSEVLPYAIPTVITLFSLASFTSSDVLLVKHLLSSDLAGIYSGLAFGGRIIFYFTSPIAIVMFPLIIKRKNKGENFHNTLFLALGIVLIPSVILTLGYFLFPQIVITYVLKKEYLSYQIGIGLMGLFFSIYSLLNLMVLFFLSLRKTNIVYVVSATAVVQVVGISLVHRTIFEVMAVSIISMLVLLVCLLLYYVHLYGRKN